jgi:hypothetical protein
MHFSNPWRLFACPLGIFSSLFCLTLARIDYAIKLTAGIRFLTEAGFFSILQYSDWLWAHQTSDVHTHCLYSPMHCINLRETALAYKTPQYKSDL